MFKLEKLNNSKYSIVQVLSVFFGLILSALAASVLDFDPSIFTDKRRFTLFILRVVLNYFTMIITYQYFLNATITVEKKQQNTAYAEIVATYWSYLTYILRARKSTEVREAVKIENERRKEEAGDLILSKVSYDLTLETINSLDVKKDLEAWINNYCENNMIKPRCKKKLFKAIRKIQLGKVKYERFTIEDVLNDSEYTIAGQARNSMRINTVEFKARRTFAKTFTFILASVITNSLFLGAFDNYFIIALIAQSFLLLSSASSGIMAAKNYISYRKQIISNRNTFLSNYIIIDEKTSQ